MTLSHVSIWDANVASELDPFTASPWNMTRSAFYRLTRPTIFVNSAVLTPLSLPRLSAIETNFQAKAGANDAANKTTMSGAKLGFRVISFISAASGRVRQESTILSTFYIISAVFPISNNT